MEGCKWLILCFENDGLQKKDHRSLSARKMRQFKQTKDCVVAFSRIAFIVFGSFATSAATPGPLYDCTRATPRSALSLVTLKLPTVDFAECMFFWTRVSDFH